MSTTDQRERQAIDEGLVQMRAGWTPEQVAAVLEDAERVIAALRAVVLCAFCGEPVKGTSVRDPVELSWIGEGAQVFCSPTCRDDWDNNRINAAGNEPS